MFDVIIIGSGPTGYTAAIYSSRAYLKTLLISGFVPGGQLTTTTEVENFPGFPDGIMGLDLMEKMKKQAERFGTEIKLENVTSVILKAKPEESSEKKRGSFAITQDDKLFTVKTDNNEYQSKSVIIATGASSKELGIPTENKFKGKGVSYCATCDGFFFRGKEVVIVGGGDTAMEEANFLTKFANSVTIIHRRDEFRASPIMLERVKKNPKISFLLNASIEEFYGNSVLQGIKVRVNKGNKGEIRDMEVDGVFVAIGHIPNTEFVKGQINMSEKGYIYVKGLRNPNDLHTETNIPGIFSAGDCVDYKYRQAIVAAGMGCMAALDVQRYLEDK